MYIFKTKEMKVPLKVFSKENSIEEQCIEQMKRVSSLPFLYHHTALMPDGHLGKGASIGSVIATKNVIIPHLIGSDIGCGLSAVKTSLTKIDTETLKKIMGEIRKVVPVGFSHQKEKQNEDLIPTGNNIPEEGVVLKEWNKVLTQIGTLGGGNHFIEIQKGSDGHIWIMIHSGSRNLGLKIANYYNQLAVKLNEKWHSSVPKSWELAYLPIDSKEGQDYLGEMKYAVDFALANRKLMMDRIQLVVRDQFNFEMGMESMINIAHNYASLENCFGENVWVHRKGATKATQGLTGIIPGSMGSKSYIVEGLGNPESFNSCSHGAGRLMSRTKAKSELSLKEEIKILDDQGIIHGIRNKGDLDEAPSAYKDIKGVMENQKDLVNIKVELSPLAVIKG